MNVPLDVIPSSNKSSEMSLDQRTYKQGLSCVHCGLCLPVCPTYLETGNEADSPRGRIQLMLGLADGDIPVTDNATGHLDLCLDCRACETACPSGVVYHELIEETQAKLHAHQKAPIKSRLLRWLFLNIFTQPDRLRMAIYPVRLMQRIGMYQALRWIGLFELLPQPFRKLTQLLPEKGELWPLALPERSADGGIGLVIKNVHPDIRRASPRRVVSFFAGCIGRVMFDEVNRQSIELLALAGADVLCPKTQGCCGAIHHHNADPKGAIELARRNINALMPEGEEVEMIVANVAGCGAMLLSYDVLLRDDNQYAVRAKRFVSKVRDISQALLELNLPSPRYSVTETVTYHDACHLAHAQRVTASPRQLLAMIPGLTVIQLPESDLCCGAAGIYNLTQPAMAGRLVERKLKHIESTGAKICVTGNAGCAMHIQAEANIREKQLTTIHPVTLLHRAYFNDLHK